MRDFKRLQSDPPQGVNGSPKSDSIMLWNAVIFGPDDTPWDGGTSRILLIAVLTQLQTCTIMLMHCRDLQTDSGIF